ncbi:MAG: universal stress protein [Solirubrobacteraceae bacterium]|nr:universal stress protein [Solirubrobacteraceae bacterium]
MHFLCGIDTSDHAPAVAYAAAHVAERMGAELTLAHVAPTTGQTVSARELDALADDVAAGFGTRPDVCVARDADPAAGLTTIARELASDLIVVGATARGRVADALRPGLRDALVEQAGCPVMVVPPGAASPTGDGVAVAYDSLAASGSAAAVAAHLASALEEPLTVVHVLPDPRSSTRPVLPMHDDVRRVVDDALDGEELDLRHVFAYRLPAAHLAQTVAQVQPALLAVAAPRRGWRSLVRPSAGARLLRRASSPVVVVAEGAAVRSRRTALVASS